MKGDGAELYNSGVVRAGEQRRSVDISVAGVRVLELTLALNGENYWGAHGDWAGARLYATVVRSGGTRSYDYDAFGNELDENGLPKRDAGLVSEIGAFKPLEDNPFRYCGEYFDDETGSVYLRARYYSPGVGRWIAEDPVRDGLNYYTYCYNNPLDYADSNGMKPYSVKASGYKGKYTLYVSPFWFDAGEVGASIGGSALAAPVLGIWGGLAFAIGVKVAMRLAGYKEVNYNITSDALGAAANITEGISKNPFVKGLAKWVGIAVDATNVGTIAYDWFKAHNYQIEEAIFNHFDRSIWVSNTRSLVDSKFSYAMDNMTYMIASGKVEVRKAVDVFGKNAFSKDGNLGMISWQYDPLSGKNMYFLQDDYYFFLVDGASVSNTITDLEKTIKEGVWL